MSRNFFGGVHIPAPGAGAADRPARRAFIPSRVVLPLSQHTGSPAEPVVGVGDVVKAGDLIAKPSGYVSAAVHASISGRVTAVSYAPTHSRARALCVTIEARGGEDQELHYAASRDPRMSSSEEILGAIRDAGVVGLGGAAFPTHVKLSPPKTKPVDTVILNGCECEPSLTCDQRLMVERPTEIVNGLEIIMKVLGAGRAFIAVEENKLAAVYAMERALEKTEETRPRTRTHRPKPGEYRRRSGSIKAAVLGTRYPQGAERQVIRAILGREVPSGGLPMDVGCIVNNVATAFAIYEAVSLSKPLVERVVTLTGPCLRESVNAWVRVGTLISDLAAAFGGFVKPPARVIAGGPMMGVAQYTMDVPVSKAVGGIAFLDAGAGRPEEGVCIRCGRCVEACAMGLVPTALMHRVKKEMFAEASALGIRDCYECGACAYSCPARIPLLEYMKYGKSRSAAAEVPA